MNKRNVFLAALMAAIAIPVLAVDTTTQGPGPGAMGPGMMGGSDRPHRQMSPELREKLKAMTPEQRQAFMKEHREKCMQATAPTEGCPQPMHPRLTQEQREQLKAMTPAERQKFLEEQRAKHQAERGAASAGMMGGPGGNGPGMMGGPGGQDRPFKHLSPEQRDKLKAMTPEQRQAYMKEHREKCMQATEPTADCPQPLHPRLTQEQRDKLKAMVPADRQKYLEALRAERRANRPGATPAP